MGGRAPIRFGNAERNFSDGLMAVIEDNGVYAEICLFISQILLICPPSVNNSIKLV